jgi:hypothetical protein
MKRLKRTFPINRKNEDAYLEQYWNEVKGEAPPRKWTPSRAGGDPMNFDT